MLAKVRININICYIQIIPFYYNYLKYNLTNHLTYGNIVTF